ncbi:MAG: MBL fold metallo-hydrolase, partial [Pseudomonadota bacterium]
MFLLSRRSILAAAGVAAGASAFGSAFPRLAHGGDNKSFSIFTADPTGALVDSTLVLGESRALLIDSQFTKPNAERLRDVIR